MAFRWGDKYNMRMEEFTSGLNTYTANLRIRCGNNAMTARTTIEAQSHSEARALLCHLYGSSNVISVTETLREQGTKVLSPDELRVKAMNDQAKRLKQQAKQIKAQQQLKIAQAQLNAATKP